MTGGSTIIDGQIIIFVNILKNREGKKDHKKIDKEEKEMKRIQKNWTEGIWLLNLNSGQRYMRLIDRCSCEGTNSLSIELVINTMEAKMK